MGKVETGKLILMDNHFPKGDHFHIDDLEYPYEFINIDELLNAFRSLVSSHFGVKL